jgi:HlyD family secretion protein
MPLQNVLNKMKSSYRFLILLSTLFSCGNNHNVITPEVKPLLEGVYASGYVVSENEYQVIAQVEGYLVEAVVKEGDSINAGDILFKIESEQQAARNKAAQEAYGIALKNYQEGSPVLNELKSLVSAAKTKLSYDSVNFIRYDNLLKSNATSKAEYDRAKLMYENSRNDFALQNSRYQKALNQVLLEYQNAKSQWQIAQNESGKYAVRSDVTGIVYRINKERGELVRRSEVLAVVGGSSYYLQLSIDELDIQRVAVGQQVLVKIDAYPDQVFNAQVAKIYPMVNQQQQSIRVDAVLVDKLPGAFTGLAVEANIIIRKKDKALVIPKSILLKGDSLQILTESGIKKVKVETGVKTFDEVEIVSGITEQTEIVKQ